MTITAETRSAFLAFVEQADEVSRADTTRQKFQSFVERGEEIILNDAKANVAELSRAAEIIRRSCTAHDLFHEARITGREDPTTELVRWLLAPSTHPKSALARQHTWLRTIGWSGALPAEAVEPKTQWATPEGPIADLIVNYNDRVVVVEAKTWSQEHEAGSTGILQTLFYGSAAQKHFKGEPFVVFMTLDGRAARGSGAPTTYAAVACAVTKALDEFWDEMEFDTREAFRAVMVHLLRRGGPVDLEAAAAAAPSLLTLQRPLLPKELRTLLLSLPYLRLVATGQEFQP